MAQYNSIEYYRSREEQSRSMAKAAKSPVIAAIHLDMAERYAKLVPEPNRR